MKDGYGYGIRPCFPLVGKWTGGIQGNQKYTKPWLKVLLLPLLLLLYSIKIERCVIACAALKRRGVSVTVYYVSGFLTVDVGFIV